MRGEGALDLVRRGDVGDPPCHLVGDRVGRVVGPRDQPGQAVGAVLGLHDEVDGGEFGRRGLVGDHDDLGRAGERRRHADRPLAATSRLAVATQTFPGPTMTSTAADRLGAVGHGRDRLRAADAYTSSTPASAAAARMPAATVPSGSGGEHSTTSATPATRAGIAVISTVEISGARPPGT